MKKIICILLCLTFLLALGCSVQPPQEEALQESPESAAPVGEVVPIDEAGPIKATISVKDFGDIVLELYPDVAPQSVMNFCYLARQGFYDGLIFHRVISGFMIQGGCPDGTGYSGPGYAIKGEFANNEFENDISHVRGVISMARSLEYDSAGSQFFIVHEDSTFLDNDYAAFGRVTSGIEVVDAIAAVGTNSKTNKPYTDVVISTITIDGPLLPEPDKLAE